MSSEQTQSNQLQTIELNLENSVKILLQYVEVAQHKGAYLLHEASLLKRAADVLAGQTDEEVNTQSALNLLVQGVVKGQRHGAYTLSDASVLDKVVTFLTTTQQQTQSNTQNSSSENASVHVSEQVSEKVEEELEELTAPVPLKTSGPRVI